MRCSVQPVRDAGELRRFLDVAYHLHREDPRWVPPLRSDVLARTRFRRNPFWKRADGRLFLARRGGDVVGRISVQLDAAVDADRSTALWGWFECEDDAEVAAALFDAAAAWAREEGARALLGPASFTAVDEAGLLVEGHDEPAGFLSPWHPPRYQALVEACGFGSIEGAGLRTYRAQLTAGERQGPLPSLRSVLADLDPGDAVGLVREHPAAWPPTATEARARLRRFRALAHPALAASESGGVAVAVRDLGEVLARLRDRLGPKGVTGILREARRTPQGAAVAVLAGPPEPPLRRLAEQAAGAGYEHLEVTVADSAVEVRAAAEALGGRQVRTYRTYQRSC